MGLGTSSPSEKLEVAGRVRATTDPTFEAYESSSKRGGIQWDATNDYTNLFSVGGVIRFDVGGERARIDTGGKLLVGKTSDDSGASNGVALLPAGNSYFTNTSGNVLRLNRKTSDGNIVDFRKDNTSIGSIGVSDDRIYFAGTNEAVAIDDSWNAFIPVNTGGSNSDNDTDLGNPSSKWKDLYLGGNATIGGNLTVSGTTTTINTATLDVEDKNITVNYSTGDSSSTADGAGITIQDAVDASNDATLLWDATNDKFDFSHSIQVPDNANVKVGSAGDLFMVHNGTNSFIQNKVGDLYIENASDDKDIFFRSDDGSGGLTSYITLDGSITTTLFDKNIKLGDSVEALFGSSSDFAIQHNGTDTHLSNGTGHLFITTTSDDKDIVFRCDDGSGGVTPYLTIDGSVGLTQFDKNTKHVDSIKATFGDGGDLEIYHTGTESIIADTGTGHLFIRGQNLLLQNADGSKAYLAGIGDVTTLYYGTSAKLATTSTGIDVTGGVNASSHFEISGTTVINSSREITSSNISATGRIKANDGLFQSYVGNLTHREYVVQTSSGGGDFLLGQLEVGGAADGAVTGCVYFAYDYGTSTESPKIHFSFHQRSGTARGSWWYENDDDAAGSNNVKVVLVDDGSGGMFVWLRVGDYGRIKVTTEWHHGGNIVNSGELSAGTITTGTTLFDTSNDPTSEHHIGKLFAHGGASFTTGNRDLDIILADSPASGNAGVQITAGASDFLGLYGGSSNGELLLGSNNTERMRIDSSGRLLIAATSTSLMKTKMYLRTFC